MFLVLTVPPELHAQSWYNTGWNYRQKITINSSITDSDLPDFPLFIKITDSSNAVFGKAQSDSDDILFTLSDGITKIPHEIEYYSDSGTEELDVWVKVPTLSSASNTVIYMYYGNASASNQENAENVWDSGHQVVLHLNENVNDEETTGMHFDSTSNNSHGSQNGNQYWPPGSTPNPKTGGAQEFDGANDLINVDNVISDDWPALTESAWAYADTFSTTDDPRVICRADSGTPDSTIFSLTFDDSSDTTAGLRCRITTDGTGGLYQDYSTGVVIENGKWYYTAFTWDSVAEEVNLYIFHTDGTVPNPTVVTVAHDGDTLGDATVVKDAIIGNVSFDDSRWWDGTIDEVRISNVARSLDWLEAEFRNQDSPSTYMPAGNFEEQVFITGTVYSDEGATPIGANKTVALSINGGTTAGTDLFIDDTDGNGFYEVFIPTANLSAGDKIIAYLDNETENGATVTVSDGDNLSGLDIYRNHIIVRHDNSGNLTNALMGLADNGDGDIDYSESAGALTAGDINDVTLFIPSGQIFQPGGDVTAGDADTASDVKIEGTFDASGTFNVFGNVSGSGSLNGGTAAIDINGALNTGTYTATTGTTTIGGDWSVSNFNHSSGTVIFDGAGTVSGGTFYNLQINAPGFTRTASGSLTVENGLTLSAGTFNPGSGIHGIAGNWDDTGVTFAATSGTITLTSANPSITQGGANNFYHLNLSSGASLGSLIDVNGDLTVSSGTLTSNNYNIEVGGSWINSGSFSAGTGTVAFDDASQTTIINGETTFNNLTSNVALGGKTLKFEAGKRQTVSGTFTILDSYLESTTPGTQWEIDAAAANVSWTGVKDSNAITAITANDSMDNGNNTNWTFPSANYVWEGDVSTDWNDANNWSTGTVPTGGGGEVLIPGNAVRMPVMTSDVIGIDNLSIWAGATVDTAGYDLIPGGNLWNFGTIRRQAGDFVNQWASSGTVVYYDELTTASDIEDYGAGNDYYNLIFEGPGITYTSNGSIGVANDLSVASGIFDSGSDSLTVGNDLIINAAGEVDAGSVSLTAAGNVSGLGTLDGQTAAIDIDGSILINNYRATTGTTTVAGDWDVDSFTHYSGTVVFDGGGSTASESYYNLQITAGNRTASGALSIENDLSIGAGAALSPGASTLTVDGDLSGAGTLQGGTATVDINGDLGTAGVPLGNYTATSGTTYVGGNWNISGTFTPGTGNVVFDNTGALSASESFYNLTVLSGASLDTQGNSVWVAGAFENLGTLYRRGGDYVSQTDSDSGAVVFRTTAGNIQSYTGDDYYNLTINQASTTFTLTGSIIVKGDLSISAGALNANNYDITVGGNWSNSAGAAGFTYGTGTVYFDNENKITVISGNTTFNDFACVTPGKTIQFTAGSTQSIQGSFIINGESGSLITLESTSSPTKWEINNNGNSEDVEYAEVQDSNNLTPANIITAYRSTDNTGNSNWSFSGYILTWNGATSSWTTASNWSPLTVPSSADSVIIPPGYTTPVLTGNVTVNDLKIEAGAVLDIAGNILTISNTFENGGTLRRYALAAPLNNYVTKTDTDSGTVEYYNSGIYVQDYGSEDYYNLTIDGVILELAKALDVNNDFEIKAGATLETRYWLGTVWVYKSITVGGNWENFRNIHALQRHGIF